MVNKQAWAAALAAGALAAAASAILSAYFLVRQRTGEDKVKPPTSSLREQSLPIPPSARHAKQAAGEMRGGADSPVRLRRQINVSKNLIALMKRKLAAGRGTLSVEEIIALEAELASQERFLADAEKKLNNPAKSPPPVNAEAASKLIDAREGLRETAEGPFQDLFKHDAILHDRDPSWLVDTLFTMHDLEGIEIRQYQRPFVEGRALALARVLRKADDETDPLQRDTMKEDARAVFVRSMKRVEKEAKNAAVPPKRPQGHPLVTPLGR